MLMCECCAHISGRVPTPAEYRWVGPRSVVTYLCLSCCTWWRMHACDDPSLMPIKVTGIRMPMLERVGYRHYLNEWVTA